MACWTLSALFIPLFVFALGIATDTSPNPPRYWHKPRHYGQVILLGTLLWAIGWLGPILIANSDAFDRTDLQGLHRLLADLAPYLPAGLGVPFAGLGIFLISNAYFRIGTDRHCRGCGYRRAQPGHRLTPTCPECGKIWSWFGETVIGEPAFSPARAAFGFLFLLAGATGIVVQAFI